MGDKNVETLCYFKVPKANIPPQLYLVEFPEFASFLYNIEKGGGGGGGSQYKPDLK